jgi:hypothetical protein
MESTAQPAALPIVSMVARPAADQPGTLGQQLDAIGLYLADPTRRADPEGAWSLARRLAVVLPRSTSRSGGELTLPASRAGE